MLDCKTWISSSKTKSVCGFLCSFFSGLVLCTRRTSYTAQRLRTHGFEYHNPNCYSCWFYRYVFTALYDASQIRCQCGHTVISFIRAGLDEKGAPCGNLHPESTVATRHGWERCHGRPGWMSRTLSHIHTLRVQAGHQGVLQVAWMPQKLLSCGSL